LDHSHHVYNVTTNGADQTRCVQGAISKFSSNRVRLFALKFALLWVFCWRRLDDLQAAINSGNSGGPALDESGRIVGVAFSGYAGSADNIGYIIPYPVISNFLGQFEVSNSFNPNLIKCISLCRVFVDGVPL
jgi:hypothetical protein